MSDTTVLEAIKRDQIGKANRQLAGTDRIAAVLYGLGREAMPISIGRHDFELLMSHHVSSSLLVEIKLEGEKKPLHAMIREMQVGPVKGNILHIDFMAVDMNETVHAAIALHLVNDPEGVKKGGVLTVDRHELNVEAKPGDLPESIDVDVSALEIGDSLHVRDVVAPKGVVLLDDMDGILASVTPPAAEEEEVTETVATEPELIGKDAEE